MKLLAAVAVSLLAIVALALLVVWAYRMSLVTQLRQRTAIRNPSGTETLERVRIGGANQWIFLRGEDAGAPVLLFLHGGPGSSLIPVARYFDSELVRHFIVAHWAQRGAGKSFSPWVPRRSMTIDQFVSDARDVAELLRRRFGKEKIFLLGISWGSTLGTYLVSHFPELFHAWVSVGTDVQGWEGEGISYRYALEKAREANDEAAIRSLEEIGPPPYHSLLDVAKERQWLRRLGGMYHEPEKGYFGRRYGFGSPEYSLLDVGRFAVGELFSAWSMYFQVANQLNLFEQAPRLEVPVFFLQGRTDYVTPGPLVERYFDRLDAPKGKNLIWFERSGHSPHLEEPERFQRFLIREVLPRGRAAAVP